MLVLSKQDVLHCVEWKSAITCMEQAFVNFTKNNTIVPQRLVLPCANGPTLFMPALEKSQASLGIKIVSVRPQNEKLHNLPNVLGTMLLINEQTGMPKAIMEAAELTAIRTAAGCAAATRAMCNCDKVQTMMVFGGGKQAKYHILLMNAICNNLKMVQIWNRNKERAKQLIIDLQHELPHLTWQVVQDEQIHVAVQASQLICTTTNSSAPMFDGKSIAPGTHITCIGSYQPTMQEVDATTIIRSKCAADITEHVWEEAGDFIIPYQQGLIGKDHIKASLGEILTSTKPFRDNDEQITLFKSVGVSLQDVALAELVYQRALLLKVGNSITL